MFCLQDTEMEEICTSVSLQTREAQPVGVLAVFNHNSEDVVVQIFNFVTCVFLRCVKILRVF